MWGYTLASMRQMVVWALILAPLWASRASAQERRSFEVAAHVAAARLSELDAGDVGVGGRLAWRPGVILGVEAEATFYPSDVPDRVPVSRRRAEALFGVTMGPVIGPVRPFARVRSGVLRVADAPRPIACIAIFPPPVDCLLAGGRTLMAVDVGGGIELGVGGGAFARVDVGDRIVRYPGPALSRGRRRDGEFWTHDVRVALGAGVRF